jgi:hypothetical protein
MAIPHARQENWLEAVKSIHADCADFGSKLIAEHDRLYGPGTGKTFVEGPYAADLPRALKARIGAQIGRLTAQPSKAEEDPAPTVAASKTLLQVAALSPRLEGEAREKEDDLPRALEARIGSETEKQTTQPTKADEPPVPTFVTATGTPEQVAAPPPPLQSDAPEQEDPKFRLEASNEAAVRKEAATNLQPTAPHAATNAELRSGTDPVASLPDENRFDPPVRPSPAYAFAFLAVLLAITLYGARRARRGRMGQSPERPVLIQARRNLVPVSALVQDKSAVLRGTAHDHKQLVLAIRGALTGMMTMSGTRA